ncbi:MAG TPA: aspartate aminotransferase family protein, partial [Spirochaetia bacterium]|nr:aspartate aminotransferase family protein [Spirochaetia bacterium]
FAAKGASIIAYRKMDYMEHQFFIDENWPGGVFLSHGLLGTRPGGAIAAAWASMMALGREGYRDLAKRTLEATQKLKDGINAIDGLQIIGAPVTSVFAYRSTERQVDIYAVGDQMESKGWHIDRLQRPEGLHAMVTPRHARVADRYLSDLAEAVETVRANPSLKREGDAPMYGMISRIPIRGAIRSQVRKMARSLYGPENRMP